MQLIVPFASVVSERLRPALRELQLPHTGALLARAAPPVRDDGEELSLSPPHERALARALGLAGADGGLPLAAVQALRDGIAIGDRPWGLLMPAHWRLGTEQVSLLDPDALQLDEPTSRALLEAVRELFESEGFELRYGAPTRWYASHPLLQGLVSASPDRVIGRNVDRWLWPGSPTPAARLLRRLQNEVQMLLHDHPVNAARDSAGALPVNSFWLSGCGAAPGLAWPETLVLDERLRAPALNDDAFAWARAWHTLDAGPIAAVVERWERGSDATLVLCGERAAVTLRAGPHGWLAGLRSRFARPDPLALLESL